jgi:protein SCO1/2
MRGLPFGTLLLCVGLCLCVAGCSDAAGDHREHAEHGHPAEGGSEASLYAVSGVVEDVSVEERQLVVAHDDISGLMPAMTMSFDVADPALLEGVAPGDAVEFTLEAGGGRYRVLALRSVGPIAGRSGGGLSLDAALKEAEAAPDFSLVDQFGERFGLADARGKVVVLDFIYTRCPGPCPVLTGAHVRSQQALAPEVRDRVHFVSISLDPANDSQAALLDYAQTHGADLDHWSFLSGEIAEVEDVLDRYAVGRGAAEDGTINHLVVTYLLDAVGNVARRYLGLEQDPKEIARDATALAQGEALPD